MQFNTTAQMPNQMPTALMLPNGQIVPVVSHANQAMAAGAPAQLQAGSNLLVPAQMAAGPNQPLTIQTQNLAPNQFVANSGLLMTTSAHNVKPMGHAMVAASGAKLASQSNAVQYLPVGGGTMLSTHGGKAPVMLAPVGGAVVGAKHVRQQIQLPGMRNAGAATLGVVQSHASGKSKLA